MKLEILRQLNQARQSRCAAIVVTDIASGEVRLVTEKDDFSGNPRAGEFLARFRSGESGMVASGRFFLTVHIPPPRLVIIGAVHISQALAPMARIAGFDVTIIDPRTAFATEDRFREGAPIAEWPDVALARAPLDRHSALAALTHDPKIDDFPVKAALDADCFYVGALGSRKTHGRRLERLRQQGASESSLARIHAPIGLAIGAHSPAEIAVAVLAEIVKALRLSSRDGGEGAA